MIEREPNPSDGLTLNNRFYVLRHGQSEANRLGLIASKPESALNQYGLTDLGRQQVAATVRQSLELLADAMIYSSDFKRTRETAEVAAALCDTSVTLSALLRERGFGQFDRQSNDNYDLVWKADALDANQQQWSVESVADVASRMWRFVKSIDTASSGKTYLIVSHGDPLQILITYANGRDLRHHREIKPLETAELRPLSAAA